jgi:hypothetical protein
LESIGRSLSDKVANMPLCEQLQRLGLDDEARFYLAAFYRKRMQDKFGNRWTISQLVTRKPRDKEAAQPGSDTALMVAEGVMVDITEEGRGIRTYRRSRSTPGRRGSR